MKKYWGGCLGFGMLAVGNISCLTGGKVAEEEPLDLCRKDMSNRQVKSTTDR